MIKDLMVNLDQIPMKSVVIDILVTDILVIFVMLLSRSWGMNIRGSIKLDLTNVVIPVFGGEECKLYKEYKSVKANTKIDSPKNSLRYG